MSEVTQTVRLPRDLADALKARAKREERSVSAVLRLLVRDYIEHTDAADELERRAA